MYQNPSEAEISDLLKSARSIAVVGLSANPGRPSFEVARELRGFGLRIIPVNPHLSLPVLGERSYSSLLEVEEPVDIVDVFRRPQFAGDVAREAVEVGAGALWLQLGVINHPAAEHAAANGLKAVMNRCLAVDYRRFVLR
ncbi:CoA-binding protein [Rubrobacter indicoceani]|uniref:CoA-binding protein n=1 Tax=Rubrobacter indicoceani TaxID=2051957 RepID=UPI000E5ADD42|nr:CoA-binding protein [Rubrobacter indicoceani]